MKVFFKGSEVTSDGGLIAVRELDEPIVRFIVTNLKYQSKKVVKFYNKRGTCEQWIKEGKYALNWTRLSCRKFVKNEARLKLFIMAYNLGNFLRRLALPEGIKHWSLRSIQLKLIKIGGRLIKHARYYGLLLVPPWRDD